MARFARIAIGLAALGAVAACERAPQTRAFENAVAEASSPVATRVATSVPVTLKAADKTTVFARHYRADRPKAIILLFHQAGSSKDEYATIGPRLAEMGYSALAIDQRSGGDLFGTNETAILIGHDSDYLDARQDLQAAIDWATPRHLPIILWGSSYSASLVFPVAAGNAGGIKALLAFSPGEYFTDKLLVEKAAASLSVPVFVTSSPDPAEIAAARAIADAVPDALATRYVPEAGVHGSSTLIADKDPQGAEANWKAVTAFLARVAP